MVKELSNVCSPSIPGMNSGVFPARIYKLNEADLEQGLLFLLQSLYPLYPHEKIVISEVNNIAVTECQELPILKRLGFELGYRVAVLWPSERK